MKACSPLMGAHCIFDHSKYRRGAAALVAALALILAIALLQRWGVLDRLNYALMIGAGRARDTVIGAMLTPLMQMASLVGGTAGRFVLLAVSTLALFIVRRGQAIKWLIAVVLGGALLNLALKQIFAAPRPDLLPHLDIVHSYSFPSGHAAGNLIFFGAIAMLIARPLGWAVAIACLSLIGVSRVWLGVHWPSDVLAGWVEGVGWLIFCATWLPALDRAKSPAYRTDDIESKGTRP